MPTVSIGIPVYNGELLLPSAIQCFLEQSYTDFELLISDNCSSDRTVSISREFAAKDSRIKVISQPRNIGAAENFNALVRMATGKYFKYASCNDLVGADMLRHCVAVLDRDPGVVIAYCRTRLIDEAGQVIEDYDDRMHLMSDNPYERFRDYLKLVRLNNVEQGLIRADALAKTPLVRGIVSGDNYLMAEMAILGKFFEVPEFQFYRRMGARSASKFKTPAELAAMLDPGKKALLWQSWKGFATLLGAVERASVSAHDKRRMRMLVLSLARHDLRGLFGDFAEAAKYSLSISR